MTEVADWQHGRGQGPVLLNRYMSSSLKSYEKTFTFNLRYVCANQMANLQMSRQLSRRDKYKLWPDLINYFEVKVILIDKIWIMSSYFWWYGAQPSTCHAPGLDS